LLWVDIADGVMRECFTIILLNYVQTRWLCQFNSPYCQCTKLHLVTHYFYISRVSSLLLSLWLPGICQKYCTLVFSRVPV
jgi:hypothetical protein